MKIYWIGINPDEDMSYEVFDTLSEAEAFCLEWGISHDGLERTLSSKWLKDRVKQVAGTVITAELWVDTDDPERACWYRREYIGGVS